MTLLEKYPSPTQTIRQGEPMPYWEAFLQWVEKVHDYFQTTRDYHGYPSIPDFWQDGGELYGAAAETEKRFIAEHSMSMFINALQHWKADADALSPGQSKTLLPLG